MANDHRSSGLIFGVAGHAGDGSDGFDRGRVAHICGTPTFGCPIFATVLSSLRWVIFAEAKNLDNLNSQWRQDSKDIKEKAMR
jgi:hypothetical protein